MSEAHHIDRDQGETAAPLVSVVIPMYNEQDYIAACVASLQAQDYPHDRLEIVVADGRSTDQSRELIHDISAQDPRVRLIDNPRKHQAGGLNLGIETARGEIIVRADAHAVYGPGYVPTIVEHLVAGRAECVGGLQRGAGATPFGKAVAAALNTPLGAGNAPYRLAKEIRYADTVWLGAWYKKTFQEIGGFDEDMPPNEDYEFNCRLRKAGGRILLDPTLPSTYFTRTSPSRLWRQYFRYGRAKVLTLKRHPETLVARQLVPPVAVGVMALCLLLTPLTPWAFVATAGLYLAVVLAVSLKTAAAHGWRLLPYLPLIFPAMHVAWAFGFFWGLVRFRGFPISLSGLRASERLVQTGEQQEKLVER